MPWCGNTEPPASNDSPEASIGGMSSWTHAHRHWRAWAEAPGDLPPSSQRAARQEEAHRAPPKEGDRATVWSAPQATPVTGVGRLWRAEGFMGRLNCPYFFEPNVYSLSPTHAELTAKTECGYAATPVCPWVQSCDPMHVVRLLPHYCTPPPPCPSPPRVHPPPQGGNRHLAHEQ